MSHPKCGRCQRTHLDVVGCRKNPNESSMIAMFEAMADRVQSGEAWQHVLEDYDLVFRSSPKRSR